MSNPTSNTHQHPLSEYDSALAERQTRLARARHLEEHGAHLLSAEELEYLHSVTNRFAPGSTYTLAIEINSLNRRHPEHYAAATQKGIAQANAEMETRVAALDDADPAIIEHKLDTQRSLLAYSPNPFVKMLSRFEDPARSFAAELKRHADYRTALVSEARGELKRS